MRVWITKKSLHTEVPKRGKAQRSKKRVTGYLKNMVNQKDEKLNQETVCGSSPHCIPSSPWVKGKTGNPSSGTITTPPTNLIPVCGYDRTVISSEPQVGCRQNNPSFPIPQRVVARCYFK
jgi:hypothetical protein